MDNSIRIDYSFGFKDGSLKTFPVRLDGETLSLISEANPSPPQWTELGENKCSHCPLDDASHRHCPVALNLAVIAEAFNEHFAYEEVEVTVSTEERTYSKQTSIQEGLGSLLGVIMVTSGCPLMEHLKPMARFHLPFATLLETVFRMASMHFMAQYFLKQDGKPFDLKLDGLEEIYGEVSQVNRDFALRLANAAEKDANANALVNLDCFAAMIPLVAEDTLKEIMPYFSAYLK